MGKNKLVTYNPFSRRMFLQGAGSLLALPFLPSMMENAYAADADYRKALFMPFLHGAYWDNWAPSGVNMTQIATNVRAGSLSNATLGPYFPADFNSLKNKISIIQGLDHIAACQHGQNTFLGAGGNAEGNSVENPMVKNTLDVILAKNKKVYTVRPTTDVIRMDPMGFLYSHCYDNGSFLFLDSNTQSFYNQITSKLTGGTTPTTMPPAGLSNAQKLTGRQKLMVDRSIASIQTLMNSTKISNSDKVVASNFFDLLRDVQTRLMSELAGTTPPVTPPPAMACAKPALNNPGGAVAKTKAQADLMVLALACGVTRLGYFMLDSEHDYVHLLDDAGSRAAHVNYLRDESWYAAAYIMKQMDAITESNGKTLLDNSGVLLSSELAISKYDNHCGLNVPVIVGGGLNGMLRQGEFISYYNTSAPLMTKGGSYVGSTIYGGRPYNELMITFAKAFGLTQAEYNNNGTGQGFGVYDCVGTFCGSKDSSTQQKVIDYYKKTFLPGYTNKDQALPHYYLG
jgi:hypothetical protein